MRNDDYVCGECVGISGFFVLLEEFEDLGDEGEEVFLVEVALVGGVEPLHDFLDFLLGGPLDVHLLGGHGEDLLQLVLLDLPVVVHVDHVERSLVYPVQLLLVLHQLLPHLSLFTITSSQCFTHHTSYINGNAHHCCGTGWTCTSCTACSGYGSGCYSGGCCSFYSSSSSSSSEHSDSVLLMRSSRVLTGALGSCPFLPSRNQSRSPPSCRLIPLISFLIVKNFLSSTSVPNLLSLSSMKNLPCPAFISSKVTLLWCLLTVESQLMRMSESDFLPITISLLSAKDTRKQILALEPSFSLRMGLSTMQGFLGLGMFTVKYRLPSRQTLKGSVLWQSSHTRGFQVITVALPTTRGFMVLVSHVCTHLRCTYFDDPAQLQGAIRGCPTSAVSRQNLQTKLALSSGVTVRGLPSLERSSQRRAVAVQVSSSSLPSSQRSMISLTLTFCLPMRSMSPSLMRYFLEGRLLTTIQGCCLNLAFLLTMLKWACSPFFFSPSTKSITASMPAQVASDLCSQGMSSYLPLALRILVCWATLQTLSSSPLGWTVQSQRLEQVFFQVLQMICLHRATSTLRRTPAGAPPGHRCSSLGSYPYCYTNYSISHHPPHPYHPPYPLHSLPHQTQYAFNPNNPFKDVAFPKKLALELINAGNNNQAILALEAHLQKNMEDGQSWRTLGRILQENDQDQMSIPCFTNCLKYSPSNLDCLLSLGVSCTNVLDEVKAMNYLKRWIMLNPKYKMEGIDHIIPDEMINLPTYKVQEIKQVNEQLIKVFDEAAKINPNDPELLSALAILFFIKREYEVSIDLFNRALNLDPTNYLLMNKVGATLAHLGRANEAIEFYHRALDIRPNYVRVWVNLGIAHAFKSEYHDAANFYLNALSFRPDAKHIWSYLHTAFLSMQRYDLIGQISQQNPHSFTEFDVINLNDLPQPEISYDLTTEKHILNRDAQSWLAEFNQK